MKKKIFLVVSIIVTLLASNIILFAAENSITINASMENSGVRINVKSDVELDEIKIYKKVDEKTFKLISKVRSGNEKEKTINVLKSKFSTETSTVIRVIAKDKNNNQKIADFEVEAFRRPTPTPSASSSPSPTASTSPRPSPTPSSTPSPTPEEIKVQKVTLNKTSTTIKEESKLQLSATITPSNATNKTLTWSTSNKKVATVDKNGKVTAVKAGKATITAKSNNNVKGTCVVTVQEKISSSIKPKSAKGDGYTQTIKLGGRTYKLYKQNKGSYSTKHYDSATNKSSSQTMASRGCGPTSIAIILSGYEYKYNPYDVGKKLLKNSVPSGISSMKKEVKAMGMKVKSHAYTSNYNTAYKQMKEALEKEHQIVLYVGRYSNESMWRKFTDSGSHFISILGIDSSNNKVYVGNPNSKANGWYDLSTVVKARGSMSSVSRGWIELYK